MARSANRVSELFQDLVVQLTVDASVTAEVIPLVLGPNDYEAVRWFVKHCGKPTEAVSGGKRVYTWVYCGSGIFASQERLLQLPVSKNRSVCINLARKGHWNIRVRGQMLR